MKRVIKIMYTNILDGKEYQYMDVGWSSMAEARAEVSRLRRDSDRYRQPLPVLLGVHPRFLRSYMVGKDWYIKITFKRDINALGGLYKTHITS